MAFKAGSAVDNFNQSITQGDSYGFSVSYKDADTEDLIPFVDGDIVTYTVRESYSENTIILQKEITSFTGEGKAEILVTTSDTADIEIGSYVFDIQVERVDGTVVTVIPDSNTICTLPVLEVCPQVTR